MMQSPRDHWVDRAGYWIALAFVSLVWIVNASFNFSMGREMGGLLLALAFLGFAVLGAFAATAQAAARGGQKWLLRALVAMQLVIGQMAGWQAMGLTLERGYRGLEDRATKRQTLTDGMAATRAEIAALRAKDLRPVAVIEPLEARECKLAPRGGDPVGPRCTALRAELGAVKRLRVLEDQLERDTGRLDKGPKVADPAAAYMAPVAIANALIGMVAADGERRAIGPDDVRFGLLVFLVAALEFVATFGFALFGVSLRGPMPSSGRATHAPVEPADLLPGRGDQFGIAGLLPAPPRYPSLPGSSPSPSAARADGVPAPGSDGRHHMSSAPTMHGAPINIHVSSPANAPAAAAAAPPPAAVGEVLPPAASHSPERPAERPRQPRLDVGVRRDARPVDRAPVRELLDRLGGFRAARVVNAVGSLIEAGEMYAAFRSWCGPSVCSEAVFHELFPAASGLEMIEADGRRWYRGAALREAALAAVG